MKIETIEKEKQIEWTIPCLIIDEYGTIVLVSRESDKYYYGFSIVSNKGWSIGALFEEIIPEDGWTLYDGKVILSNN